MSITYYQLYARSDTERLHSLTEKQAQEIAENVQYIKELEDRERLLTQNVMTNFIEHVMNVYCAFLKHAHLFADSFPRFMAGRLRNS